LISNGFTCHSIKHFKSSVFWDISREEQLIFRRIVPPPSSGPKCKERKLYEIGRNEKNSNAKHWLRFIGLFGVSQKMELFLDTVVRTTNATKLKLEVLYHKNDTASPLYKWTW
jgi:hypothetical protein